MKISTLVDLSKEFQDTNDHYWCETEPNVQRAWSPSSLDTFQSCPRKYYYAKVRGLQSPKRKNEAAEWGKIFHSAMEFYWHARLLRGIDHLEAAEDTLGFAFKNGRNFEWDPEDNTRDTFTLCRAVVWYLDANKNSEIHPIDIAGNPALELMFKLALDIINPDGQPYIVTGILDAIMLVDGDPMVWDYKTTKTTVSMSYFRGFSMSNQVDAYLLASSLYYPTKDLMIDCTQTAVSMSEFGRHVEHREENQLAEWLQWTMKTIQDAEHCAETESYPMNRSACGHYGGCEFRKICSVSPDLREDIVIPFEYEVKRRENIDYRKDS